MYKYERPKHTHQDLLSSNDINTYLKNYKLVENITDIQNIPIGTHIRYFTIQADKTKKFRLGGYLQKIDPQYRYITLTNGTINWSAQLNSSIIYKKLSEVDIEKKIRDDIKKELSSTTGTSATNQVSELKNEIKKLNVKLKQYKDIELDNQELKKKYNTILKKNEKLNDKIKQIEDEIVKNKKK
jgi:hypothetical protein